MKWLTNCAAYEAGYVIERLSLGWKGRVIVEGEPKPSTQMSLSQMKSQGIVGLYEQHPGTKK